MDKDAKAQRKQERRAASEALREASKARQAATREQEAAQAARRDEIRAKAEIHRRHRGEMPDGLRGLVGAVWVIVTLGIISIEIKQGRTNAGVVAFWVTALLIALGSAALYKLAIVDALGDWIEKRAPARPSPQGED